MRKRLFLFVFAAIAGTLTALSDDYIWISGHKMSFDSSWAKDYTYFTDASSGSVKWDASTRTLTLNNFVVDRTYVNYLYSGTKDCIVFYSKRSVTIELQGNNKLYTPYRYTLALQGNTTFTGDGFLCISNGDNKKPCIDMLEEDLTITFDGPRFTLEARNSGIRGKNNTGTLRFKAGEMTVKPLNMLSNNRIVSDLGNIVFDYGMGIKMYGVYYNKAKHCMMGSKDEELIGGCVDFGPIEYYGFAICGTWITKYNCDNIEKFVTSIRSGSVKYDPDENYLRLDNVTLLNGTTAPTILNENNKYLHIGFRGKNTFQFEGERGRWAMNLKENTDISGGQLDVIGADYAGIHVGSDKSLYLKNVTLNIPFMKGGNLNSRLYLESGVEINATGNTDIGTLGWLQVQEYGDQHDVAVESNMSQPRFFWNAARVPGVYANLNELAKGPVHISTKAKSYPVDICGQGVNALNKNNIINQYLKSGRIYYDDEGLHLYNAELDYEVDDFDDMTDPALKFYSDSHIYLEGTNKIKCNDVEAIKAFKDLTIQNYASYASLTIEGPNAEIYTSGTLGLIDTKVTAPRISSEKLNVHGSWFNVTRKLGADKVSLSEEKVASTPDAPAYYDSEKQQIVAPKGPVSFLPSSEVTVYDGIQFCGEEINSANHTCVMNKYVDEGSLSVEKVSNGYTVSMHGITVKSENDVDIFNFTSLGTVGLNLYGHFNIFDTKGHFIKGVAKNIYIYGKEKDGVENCLMVEGSSTSNAGAVSVAANSSLYIYKGDANNLYVSVPRIYGQGTTSKLYVNDPYLYVRGFQRGTVSNITCAMTNSKVELYNTSSSPREIRSDGIYENGSLCTGEVKFVGKGESYIPVKRIEVDHRSWTFDTKGQTLQLKATVLPEDATNKKVYWRSGDEAVAKVDQNGKVTAVSRGSASIFAYAEETIDQDEESPNSARRKSLLHPNANACVVHVIIPEPYDITLSETDVLIDRESIGGFYLTANLTPDNAETDYFEWESSDETLVTVLRNSGKTALVRRVGDEGQATITVKTANGLSASCNVTVHYPITPITVQFAQRTYTLNRAVRTTHLYPHRGGRTA